MAVELMYWLPPSRVKQSGAATIQGGHAPDAISRSSRRARSSPSGSTLNSIAPVPVKPVRASSAGSGAPS